MHWRRRDNFEVVQAYPMWRMLRVYRNSGVVVLKRMKKMFFRVVRYRVQNSLIVDLGASVSEGKRIARTGWMYD